ncbi:hypothetical protein [Ruegeria sp. HKCCA5463]|uniref:hypothetical protein n=1 Tax=Ruegeria sp. HKCCA5463 TaxID=2682994 RepID=UPI0014888AC0|nr:hypothetical protein [Ruegeria sp. HKCCA5463]
MIDFSHLISDKWVDCIDALYPSLKKEMQGTDGFVRRVKASSEPARKSEIQLEMDKFISLNDLSDLDDQIDELARAFLRINNKYSSVVYYDHLAKLDDGLLNAGKPTIAAVAEHLLSSEASPVAKDRLKSLVARVVNESLSQANKSNAGEAGENIARAILSAAGLMKDEHYREQYKSKSGSDTDFVFPCVPDQQDQKVELFMAVQMSSNDRTRLTSSELKIGGKPFVFTGNGLTASKKKLKDIGAQIVESQKSNKVNLICFRSEIEREKERLRSAAEEVRNANKRTELLDRLNYFEDYTWTISEFAEHVKKRFA